jgi:hypothetical protein
MRAYVRTMELMDLGVTFYQGAAIVLLDSVHLLKWQWQAKPFVDAEYSSRRLQLLSLSGDSRSEMAPRLE